MKMTILLGNGKRGTINLVSSSIIAEDFKANICKKLKIDANQFKLKIDFLNNEIELLAVDIIEKSIKEDEKLLAGVSIIYYEGAKLYLFKDCWTELGGLGIWQIRDMDYQIKGNQLVSLSARDFGGSYRTQFEFVKAVHEIHLKLKREMNAQLLDVWGNPLQDYTKREKRILNDISNYLWDSRKIDVDVIQFSKDNRKIYIGFKNTRADFEPLFIHGVNSDTQTFMNKNFTKKEVKEIAQLIASNREGK